MEDIEILALYQSRNEDAISMTQQKYGSLCITMAYHMLGSREDAEECLNDALMHLWNAIPPAVPQSLGAFLVTAVRNAARDRLSYQSAQRRGSGQLCAALDELSEIIPSPDTPEQVLDSIALRDAFKRFVPTLSPDARSIFLRRYWFCMDIKEIADDLNCSEGRVHMSLMRTRKKLQIFLSKEGYL